MRYTTNLLTTLVIFTTASSASSAQAQDFLGFLNPLRSNYRLNQPSYRVTPGTYQYIQPNQRIQQSNYQYVSPNLVNQSCRNGTCFTTQFQSPYLTEPYHGLSTNCLNGQCNHFGHQRNQFYSPGCLNGQCPLPAYGGDCLNGQCGTATPGVIQYQNGYFPGSPIPVERTRHQTNYGVTQFPLNHPQLQFYGPGDRLGPSTSIPSSGTSINQPKESSPYYN